MLRIKASLEELIRALTSLINGPDCIVFFYFSYQINPLTVKLFNLNFHPLQVVSRWRDPQLQVSEIIQIWQNGGQLFLNIAD